ncbi:reverse transcriptase domain-containing protein [Tanacetum coccineum]
MTNLTNMLTMFAGIPIPLLLEVQGTPRVIPPLLPEGHGALLLLRKYKGVQPPVVQVQPHVPNSEPVIAPVSVPMPNPQSSIPYPSRQLTPTFMTLELADRSITQPISIAEDVYLKVGKFKFPADFVVVYFDADPRVPLILRGSFLKTGRALIDVYEGELTLRDYSQENSRFLRCDSDGQSHLLIMTNRSLLLSRLLTPSRIVDFLLEGPVNAFLALEDDLTSPEVDDSYYDLEGDILLLEAFLNDDPSLPPPTQGNYFPEIRKETKVCEAKN